MLAQVLPIPAGDVRATTSASISCLKRRNIAQHPARATSKDRKLSQPRFLTALWSHSLLVATLYLGTSAHAVTVIGHVVGVADGDTITVLDAQRHQHKVRLGGIDAPEKTQAFGQHSKASLSRLVFQKDVHIEYDKRDRYGRIIGRVMVQPPDCTGCPMTLDVGVAQLTDGLAWWYRKYAKDQSADDRRRYESLEQKARARRVGLWQGQGAIPPWEWRRR